MSPVHHHTSPVHHFTSPPLLVHSLFSVRTNNARNSHGSPLNNESSSHGSPLRQAQLSQNNLRHKALEEHIHEVGVEVPQAIMPHPLFDITKSFYLSVHDHERCSVSDLVWLAQEAIELMQRSGGLLGTLMPSRICWRSSAVSSAMSCLFTC